MGSKPANLKRASETAKLALNYWFGDLALKRVVTLLSGALIVAATVLAADATTPRKASELAFNVPGQGQKMLSQYHGKVVAIEFIWTTCPHCQAWSKTMTKFQNEYGSKGFQAIDVAINDNADLLVENFGKDFQVNFPVGWTVRDQMISFMGFSSAYFVVPQLALIDRKGVIRYQTPARESDDWDKLMKEDVIRQHIEELLSPNSANAQTSGTATRAALAKK